MKYYLIAGESSGDHYGGLLMKEIKQLDSEAKFRFWGGDKMLEQDDAQDMSIKETSFMGLWVVLMNIFKIKALFKKAKSDILSFSPDLLILIDYPGFNLRMLKWAHRKGIRTCHIISPQIWAWRKYRYKILRDYADLFYIVLPFEQDIYDQLGVRYEYHGHPILDIHPAIPEPKNLKDEVKTIGLFPGSRKQEIQKLMGCYLGFARTHLEYNFIISRVAHIETSVYSEYITEADTNIRLESDLNKIYQNIDLAIACSGTISLELCVLMIPQIVVYKASPVSYYLAKNMIKAPYISLVNLIAQKELVKELIQNDLNQKSLSKNVNDLLQLENRKTMLEGYSNVIKQLGDGTAIKKIAGSIYTKLEAIT